ncbi:MAG: hypothetical protein M1546_14725, partial [Chloroflexi bacterium]|nr:hypothetical protein [Chloroflexota bacterium]
MERLNIVSVEPTVFFIRAGDALRQRVHLTLESGTAVPDAALSVRAAGVDELQPLHQLKAGSTELDVYLPDLRVPGPVTLGLLTGGVR